MSDFGIRDICYLMAAEQCFASKNMSSQRIVFDGKPPISSNTDNRYAENELDIKTAFSPISFTVSLLAI